MGYLGNNLQAAYSSYLLIDSLTASFNGTTTSFPLRVNGITPVPFPVNEQNVLISVGGVPQKPDPTGAEGFRFSGSNIVFSSAPKTGEAFWGVVLAGADYINVGADFPDGSASAPSITFASEKSTGFYKVSSGTVGVALNGSLGPLFTGSGVYLNNTNNGLYSPGTNELALSTAGTGRLFINSSGNVGIGTASPGVLLDVSGGQTRILQSGGTLNTPESGAGTLNVYGLSTSITSRTGTIRVESNSNSAIDTGSSIAFSSRYIDASTQSWTLGKIGAYKVTATSGQAGGYLAFATTTTGGFLTERLRITDTGSVGIGTASPGTSRTYIQCDDTNTAGLTISGINSSGGVSGFSTLKLIGNTPNAVNLHYGAEFIKSQSSTEGITGYYADVTGAYQTQTNFHAKLTKNLAAATNGYCYYADLSTSSSGGAAYFHYCYNSTSTALRFSVQDSGQVVINSAASTAPFIARVNNAESLRIDSSGRLLVGTSSAISNVARFGTDFTPGAQFVTNTASWNTGLGLINYAGGGFAPALTFGLSSSSTIGTNTLVSSGNRLGVISFNGNDGTNFEEAARIEAFVDGTPGANDMPGRLVFFTTADGAATPTERVRITSTGELLIGTTTTTANGGKLQVSNGITFPATQVACTDVNTLDDYEEGTWTPTLSSGGTSPVYTDQIGRYTKIGNLVCFTMSIKLSTVTPAATAIQFAGLPFNSNSQGSSAAVFGFNGTFDTNTGDTLYIPTSSNTIVVYANTGLVRLGNAAGVSLTQYLTIAGSYGV